MKSESKKIQNNLSRLKDTLYSGKSLTINKIMTLLSCNRRSAYNYLERLSKEGHVFKQIRDRHSVRYSLEHNPDESVSYDAMSLDTLRKYTILSALSSGPVPVSSFKNMFSFSDKAGTYSTKKLLDIRATKFHELLDELKAEKEIEERNGKYYLTGNTVPMQLALNEDELYNLNEELSAVPKASPYYAQLHSILEKTELLIGETDTEYSSNYILYGRRRNQMQSIHQYMQLLRPHDFQHRSLNITYQARDGRILQSE